uniref:Peroxiredoxin-like 2A n=1 Tax=Hucho hucho TaxID=62062 RepID=A0A4W5Q851_9TELE
VLNFDTKTTFAMDVVVQSLGAVVALIATGLRSFSDLFLTQPSRATLKHLEETVLKPLTGEREPLKAKRLWEKSGAVIMAEAAELSSLKPQLEELGVPLYAVVKEDIGTEIQNFRPYFNGEIFMDDKRCFYGPRERKMGLLAFLRLGVWMNGLRAFKNGFLGNVFGEGFVLGGVFVIGAGQQGVLLEHREMEFGDKVNILDVLKAARKVQTELVSLEK